MNYLCKNTTIGKVMDIATLSSLINELIIKEEEVVLPHIGKFYYKIKQASISKDGKEMLPPSKQILFVPNVKDDTSGIAFLYSEKKGIHVEEAKKEVLVIVDEILNSINKGETFTLPNLGKLFIEDGLIAFNSEGFNEYMPEKYLENINLNPESDGKISFVREDATRSYKKRNNKIKKTCKVICIVIVCLILFILLIYLFREPLKPLLEQIFYTSRELEILKEWGNQ